MTALIWVIIVWVALTMICGVLFGPMSDRDRSSRRSFTSSRFNRYGDF